MDNDVVTPVTEKEASQQLDVVTRTGEEQCLTQ